MTTAISESNKKLPSPAELNRRLAWAAINARLVTQARTARRRRIACYALAVAAGAVALWLVPSYALACIALGLPSAILAAGWWAGRNN